ncbi:unnamed protein product [Aureobasidium mustum]|uniref:RING-type domain-containing protein n=1 Tax=Aureobasidium mustum TaxID=2773714 RepID=A0A9N8K396_9PEZI|nr:unnamed protein product [Aureobasidium mustum]
MATLTQPPRALQAQTPTPTHDVPPSYDPHHTLHRQPSSTPAIMDQPNNDLEMEGAADPWLLQPQTTGPNSATPNPEPLSPARPPPPPLAPVSHTAGEDSEEEDDEDDDRSHISDERARSFYPFHEDTTVPDAEETRIMRAYAEANALDDAHWQSRTFFDLQDSGFSAKEQGIIEWTINDFNGTKENPRKNLLLTSHTVSIGGYDWRVKLMPHGNMHTDRLSLYVECVSVQSSTSQVMEWPADQLPLPLLGDAKVKVMKPTSVAAQVSALLYNPDEPRVNEFKADASQFSQVSPDHGWTRFTSVPWYEIHRRSYAQRQPLLRNDTLAVKAYIRVIDDPTGCLWAPKDSSKLALTGLHPFCDDQEDSALCPVLALWLHLRPFRQMIYQLGAVDLFAKDGDNIVTELQSMLWRMRSRIGWEPENHHAPYIGDFIDDFTSRGSQDTMMDAMQTMDTILNDMKTVLKDNKDALEKLTNLFGTDTFSGNRPTKRSIEGKASIQEIVNDCFHVPLLLNEVLTIELERQVFDKDKRVWMKLLDKVLLDDQITTSDGSTWTLYGFVAHEGYLRNGKYTSHFRPGGLGGLWYTYMHDKDPTCQTRTQAVASKEGVSVAEVTDGPGSSTRIEEPVISSDAPINYGHALHRFDAVAYVVIYVRSHTINSTIDDELWDVPEWIPRLYGPPQADAAEGANTLHSDMVSTTADEDEEMNDPPETSPNEEPIDSTVTKVTIDYLSQPFYRGDVNSASECHGYGHLIYLNGDEYNGYFSKSQRSGQGKMRYANRDTYDGHWKDGQPDGHGVYTQHRTGNVYEGNWSEGKRSGTGVMYYKVSEEDTKLCRICYTNEANAAFYDCGHVLACIDCARRVEDCPICRRRVRDVVRLFYTA